MRDAHTQVVLRDDLHGKVVLQHIDERVIAYRGHQSALDLCTGIIGVVKDTELRVSALAVQIILSVGVLVEVHAPLHQFLYLFGCTAYHLLHGCRIANPVAGYHRVVDMLVEIIDQQVSHRCYAALGFGGVRLVEGGLAAQGDPVLLRTCHLQRKTHTGHAAADDQIIVFVCHLVCLYSW